MKIKDFLNKRKKNTNAVKLGLALGSGGFKGFAHVGALRAFEEAGIKFDYVAGTSVGSIIGCLYCFGYNTYEMIEIAKTINEKDLRDSKIFFMPSSSSQVENVLKKFIGDTNIEDLKLPFRCVAVNLKTGKEIVFSEGCAATCVSGSCAAPPFFKPVVYNGMHLIDGAYANPLPSGVCKEMGADFVVTVDLDSERGYSTNSLNMFEVLMASVKIAMKSTAEKGKLTSDVIITPNLAKYKANKFEGVDEMFTLGYESAKENIEAILSLGQN